MEALDYDKQHNLVDQIVQDEIAEEGTEADGDKRAIDLVGIGLHCLIDIAESLDSINAAFQDGQEALKRD
jgi:hypothetical protein